MSVYVPVDLQRKVRDRFHNCCAYCRTSEHLSVSVFEFEHIEPQSLGGETVFANLCLACGACNRFKSDRVSFPDPQTGLEQDLFHPQRDEWSDHFAWSGDECEILALTAKGRTTAAALRMNRPQLVRLGRIWVMAGEHPPTS